MAEDKSRKTEAYLIAEADSRDCPICCGQGMSTVYAPDYDGSALRRDSSGRPYIARTMAHCRCPLGRYLRASSGNDVVRRTPDVMSIGEGYSTWSLIDPIEEPVDDPGRPVTGDDFDAFRRMLANRPMVKVVDDGLPPNQSAWSIHTALRKRLARELGLDERLADVLTIEELHRLQEHKCST